MTGKSQRFTHEAKQLGDRWYDVFAFRVGPPEARRVAVLFKDVTEQRKTEQALLLADQQKNRFLATLAHELRNPLAPVRLGIDLLRTSRDDEESFDQTLGVMERQLKQMVRLIDDLLDVSRITRGKVRIQKERCTLQTILQDALEGSQPVIDESGVELKAELPSIPIELEADPIRLAQVFSNLLNNAAKYTDRGGRVELRAERQGSDAVVQVLDTGIGIDGHTLPLVFEAFSQAEHSLNRSQGGLGIGLSLVHALVQLHGGSVRAYSDGPGKGSEFVVRLPLQPHERYADDDRPAEDDAGSPLPSRRVLVVDDNVDAANMLGLILRQLGQDVRTVNSGAEALSLAEDFRPELILLDIGMPEMDGHEVARRVRAMPWGAETVLTALTGWGQESDREKSLAAGIDHHCVKPLSPHVLRRLLADLPTRAT